MLYILNLKKKNIAQITLQKKAKADFDKTFYLKQIN